MSRKVRGKHIYPVRTYNALIETVYAVPTTSRSLKKHIRARLLGIVKYMLLPKLDWDELGVMRATTPQLLVYRPLRKSLRGGRGHFRVSL